MTRLPKEFVPGGDLDDRAHVAARPHGHRDLAHGHTEDLAVTIVDPQPVVGAGLAVLRVQVNHQIDALALSNRGHAVEILDVQDTEASHLDVMAEQRGRLPEHHAGRLEVAFDDVVRHQPMASHHELEGALALADTALAQQQHADLEDVDEHAVDTRPRRQSFIEQAVDRGDRPGRSRLGEGQGGPGALGLFHQDQWRRCAAGHDHEGELESKQLLDGPQLLVARQALDVRHLRLAEDLDAGWDDAVRVADQRQTRLLDARVGDPTIEPGTARDHRHRVAELRILDQRSHRQGPGGVVRGLVDGHVTSGRRRGPRSAGKPLRNHRIR